MGAGRGACRWRRWEQSGAAPAGEVGRGRTRAPLEAPPDEGVARRGRRLRRGQTRAPSAEGAARRGRRQPRARPDKGAVRLDVVRPGRRQTRAPSDEGAARLGRRRTRMRPDEDAAVGAGEATMKPANRGRGCWRTTRDDGVRARRWRR